MRKELIAVDLLYIGIALLFFALSWGLVWVCDHL